MNTRLLEAEVVTVLKLLRLFLKLVVDVVVQARVEDVALVVEQRRLGLALLLRLVLAVIVADNLVVRRDVRVVLPVDPAAVENVAAREAQSAMRRTFRRRANPDALSQESLLLTKRLLHSLLADCRLEELLILLLLLDPLIFALFALPEETIIVLVVAILGIRAEEGRLGLLLQETGFFGGSGLSERRRSVERVVAFGVGEEAGALKIFQENRLGGGGFGTGGRGVWAGGSGLAFFLCARGRRISFSDCGASESRYIRPSGAPSKTSRPCS